MLDAVQTKLLTPYGLRSLAPGHPDYKPYYDGDLRSRDAAYHQGTVWGWLAGPYADAWLKVHPGDHRGAERNERYLADLADWTHARPADVALALDPQTSGGLLVTCTPARAEAILAQCRAAGFAQAAVVGRFEAGPAAIRVEA